MGCLLYTSATVADDADGLELALGETAEQAEETQQVYDDTGAAIYVSSTPDTYFVQAKLDREQARASQKDMLTEMINNENIDEAKRCV